MLSCRWPLHASTNVRLSLMLQCGCEFLVRASWPADGVPKLGKVRRRQLKYIRRTSQSLMVDWRCLRFSRDGHRYPPNAPQAPTALKGTVLLLRNNLAMTVCQRSGLWPASTPVLKLEALYSNSLASCRPQMPVYPGLPYAPPGVYGGTNGSGEEGPGPLRFHRAKLRKRYSRLDAGGGETVRHVPYGFRCCEASSAWRARPTEGGASLWESVFSALVYALRW